ncbi:MAG: MBL fold metallo-hydrolase [Oscillospiraceae bacterium]|jgi:glyoxylase-like metal-dependent hydrolase (beta-lactamase superfamily II)|nr:MBL fold metallo-hydrolase [Oscillospiraceae bacterium]
MLQYTTICAGMLRNNTYILKDEESGALAVIDCGFYNRRLEEAIRAAGGSLQWILLTHGHFDHVEGAAKAKATFPHAKVAIGKEDAPYLRGEMPTVSKRPLAPAACIAADWELSDGDVIPLGASFLSVMHTPGHTPGGVCFVAAAEQLIFSGDTLFFEDVGRDDLPGGDWEQEKNAILRLYALPGDYTVLPGHNQPTTLNHERQFNPYVRA